MRRGSDISKKDLLALNEKLAAENDLLRLRLEEQNQAGYDMETMLAGAGVASLLLDRHLNIKRFTPALAELFSLKQSDTGRPFHHFADKIDWTTFALDAETVLAGLPFAERVVSTLDRDRCFLKRIVSNRTTQGSIDGITVTFIDITQRKSAEEELLKKNLALESLAMELSLAEERERDRIAGELHDQVGQQLIFGKMKLDALASQLEGGDCLNDILELARIVELSIHDIRSLTFQLRPPLLASVGLEAALCWLGEEFQDSHGLLLSFLDDGQSKPMKYEVRSIVFQAAREVLLNTVKHAGATHFGIKVGRHGGELQLCLSDDGCGFDLAEARIKKSKAGGFGLINVQCRIEHLGGSFFIDSRPGNGTRITITTPLDLSNQG